ncbi:hypothetical protein ACB094_09G081500 [Castanea mollissima]
MASRLYLQNLRLASNNFNHSRIPPEFGNLTNLSYLNLSNAGFSGPIPTQISRLTRLVTLDLSTLLSISSLSLESPDFATLVQNLSHLTELYLDGVNLSAPGNEWCQALSSSLPNLSVLSMSYCFLSGPLHSSLQKLQSLSVIHLNNNRFYVTIPEFFADFTNLSSLKLSSSRLIGTLPRKILQVPTLQLLDLSKNELNGSLPEFHPNGALQSLLLSRTKFSGTLPTSIGNLKKLSKLDLSGCNFNGSIPISMENLTHLVHLDMSFNNFSGPVPSFIMAKNLTEINLSNNNLTGQITFNYWKELRSLVNLDLRYNSLEGSIPMSLFSLPLLQKLQLSYNHFSGQLPEFFNVSSYQLDTLDLISNNLEGPIPMSIFELRGLQNLLLSSNNFSGSWQLNAFQQLRNLSNLGLSHNSLLIEYNGANSSSFPKIESLGLASTKLKTVPDFLRNQSNLVILDLSDNQIHGKIPKWIWKFTHLLYLNLSHNYLEGPLLDLNSSTMIGQLSTPLPSVMHLDLSRNNFNSVIPASIGSSIISASFLSLSSNKFHGHIPESICNAKSLQVLDLSHNSLSGTLPQCFSTLSRTLGVLNLRRNNLIGTIFDKFSKYCHLQTLNLNGNLLEGVFDIGNNQIHDAFPCHLKIISNLRILGPNDTWPVLQIVDLASNNFSGRISIKALANSKTMMADNKAYSELKYLHYNAGLGFPSYYQNTITVVSKGLQIELVKILTLFTSIDLSCNNLDGPIPKDLGLLKALHILNLSFNAFTDPIPPSLGKLSELESLDLSSNKLNGEIPMQLADGLTFLSVLNLSFNQLVGPTPFVKQFATFLEASYEGNKGLCGPQLKTKCGSVEPHSPPPTFEDAHPSSRPSIDWNFLSVELGFAFGFGTVIMPLMFLKRWRIWYYKYVDDIFFRIFPQLYLGGKIYRQVQAHRNQMQRH